ncbi:glycosyltransferase family 4 protein [Vibrio sp. MM46]|uniref:glycosyltransferase family 4 protein n=1 Tax=Vibrio TaxID=662 RepID=UPI0022CD2233|nr:glycosyltransferase family 4 protein [Vibrio sp. MM46]MDA0123624.1 glycosyltransferase family 4 protein [Vibrio sp. MM46]
MLKVTHVINKKSPTSMGYNEFYNYQKEAYKNIKIDLLSLCDGSINFLKGIYTSNANVFHVHSHQLLFIVYIVKLLSVRNRHSKIIYTVHTSRDNLKGKNYFFYCLNKLFADKVVYCSLSSRSSFGEKAFNSKSIVIRNGVDISENLTKWSKNRDIDYISVGRLVALKRPMPFVRELAKMDVNTYIVGEGPLHDDIENLNSKNIVLTGLIERKKVYELLKRSNFYVTNSSIEGMPIALLEAIGAGCVPVVSNIPPHQEVLDSGIQGIVLKDDIQSVLETTRNFDSKTIDNIRRNNKEILESTFSLKSMNESYFELYRM